jgi:hypothetical protein
MTLSVIPLDKKTSPDWILLNINLLICSLFTILSNDKLFKELNINKYYCSFRLNEEFILIDPLSLNNLFLLLNKPLVRQLAYNILQPVLEGATNTPIKNFDIRSRSANNQLVKNYLKKFRYFYKLFFLDNSFLIKPQLTDKEINFLAIKFLFILIGI